MGEVLPWPAHGDVFADVRGDGRTMRVSCHADRGVVVVSLWAGARCRGSFRLAADEVPRFLAALSAMTPPDPVSRPSAVTDGPNAAPAAPNAAPAADPCRGDPPAGERPQVA